jgi:hypothetical protein
MKKYMSVTITICSSSCINGAYLYYSDDELGLEISTNISYEEGMKQLRQLEKRLGKPAKMKINQFDRGIAYKELYGYIDRE